MRLGNKKIMLAGLTIICLFLGCTRVSAAEGLSIVESCTGETEVILYLKGVSGELTNIQVQAGTAACSRVTADRLIDSRQPVKTLVMLDNSLSIKKTDRAKIKKMLQNIIDMRMEQEELAIAVFQEGVTWLADYTSDDETLKQAVADISYQSSNTYLTDVLYELLSAQGADRFQDVYRRIVLISDGMDNKSIGYTKDELTALIKEDPVPIYTVGMLTKKKDNQKQLKNMFAISRMTKAESYLLGDTEELPQIGQDLREDSTIVRLAVRPPDELLDGSRKMFKITLASGESVSAEAVMPQQVKLPEQAAGQSAVSDNNDPTALETDEERGTGQLQKEGDIQDTEDDKDTQKSAGTGKLAAVVLALCLLAAAIAAIFLKKKASSRKVSHGAERPCQDSESMKDKEKIDKEKNIINPYDYDDADADDEETDIMEMTEVMNDEKTVSMWDPDNAKVCSLVLTDIRIPQRSFQIPIQTSTVIGRKQGVCGIVIHDDRSVSNRHCEIMRRDGNFYIKDLQSSNGTCVNGTRIMSETKITSGSVIKMGNSEFKFEVL